MFKPNKLARSFFYASRGIWKVAREEQNFRIELLAAAAVVVMLAVFDFSAAERAILALAIVLVLVLELLNSIFERMVDLLKPRLHHYVEDVKDIMAGTVFTAAVGSAVIAVLIIWPKLAAFL